MGSSSGARPRRNCRRLWSRNAFGTEPTSTLFGRSTRRASATSASGNGRCSRSSAGDDRVEARVREREWFPDVCDHGLDAERLGLRAPRSTSRPTTSFPSRKCRVRAPERHPMSRTRFPLPIAALEERGCALGRRRSHPRRAAPDGAPRTSLPASSRRADGRLVAERGDRPPEASLSSTSGPQPRSWRARDVRLTDLGVVDR